MFHGSIPALVTPFKNNTLDHDVYEALVDRQIKAGSSALVPVGTTGESATLSHEEHRTVVSLCIKAAQGRVPIIAAKEAGADAALVVCPYYNRPNQSGMEAHFRAINDAVQLPVFIYNVPGRTVSDILPETVGRLAKLPNIIGIKDATGDLARVTQHRLLAGEDFTQLSGDDPTALGHRAMGGSGCISVTANVAPKLNADMHKAAAEGDFAAARAIELKLIRLHKDLFVSPSPGPTKYAMSKLGLCEATVRLPITPPDADAKALVDEALFAAGLGG